MTNSKSIISAIIAAGFVTMAGMSCQIEEAAEANTRPLSDGNIHANMSKADCAAAGGNLEVGLANVPTCFTPFNDGGKSCTSGTECEGLCLAKTRTCQKTGGFGCFEVLNNGKAANICID